MSTRTPSTALVLFRTRVERTIESHRQEFSKLGQQLVDVSGSQEGYTYYLNRMDPFWKKAAEVDVFSTCLHWMRRMEKEWGEPGLNDVKVAAFFKELSAQALSTIRQHARYSTQSTSSLSNLAEREKAAAWEKVLGHLEELLP